MVMIERPEAPTWKTITVRRKSGEIVELRFDSSKSTKSDKLTASEARRVACLLLAAVEHPIDERLYFERRPAPDRPLIVKRAPSGPVELRLRKGGPYAKLSLPTTRRIAHALLAESQQPTLPDDAP